ncbi:MAG: type II toxin-antitoxin system VapC family toxin [Acidobacteriia bacterium]|nr:type II toxin-antitoxin system VapC family toxin [Terriglobia bacterium]
MDHLVDTNVLLRSVDRTHAMHKEAVAALTTLLNVGEALCFTPQNMIEFWSACTRPVDRNGLGLLPREADIEASRLEKILTLLPDNPSVYPEWRRLVVAHGVSGVQVHDARLVAAMSIYNVKNILTFNGRDFARYPNIGVSIRTMS